jgi:hypothetical protein
LSHRPLRVATACRRQPLLAGNSLTVVVSHVAPTT